MVHDGVKCRLFGDTFGVSFCILCAQVVLWAQKMCPHASGVMLLGARGFVTQFIAPCVQYRTIFGSTRVSSFVNSVIRLL